MNHDTIKKEMRLLDGVTLRKVKKVARHLNITAESLIWVFNGVFSDGTTRSNSYYDAPKHVIDDGIITERHSDFLHYIGWKFTAKGEMVAERLRP
jgi:hypothetical protein